MSSHNFPIGGFGLVIQGADMEYFLTKLFKRLPEEKQKDFEDGKVDPWFLEEHDGILDNFTHEIHYHSDVESGEIFTLDHDWIHCESDFIIIYTQKQPQIIGTAYNNKEEIFAELKKEFTELLPSNFDWENYVGEVTGCIFG